MFQRRVFKVARAFGLVLLVASTAIFAPAQDSEAKILEQRLQTKLRGGVLILREPHIGSSLKYDLNGITKSKSGLRGLSDELVVEDVKVHDHELLIAGRRLQDAYDRDKKTMVLSHSKIPVEVRIATADSSEAEVTKRFSQTFLLRSDLERRKCPDYSYFEESQVKTQAGSATQAGNNKKKSSEMPDRESKEMCMPSGVLAWTIGRGTTIPHPTHDPDPTFPKGERAAGVQGTVLLTLRLDESGIPTDGVVLRTPSAGFLEATSEAVRSWRFAPVMKDGKPVPAVFTLEVNFHLY